MDRLLDREKGMMNTTRYVFLASVIVFSLFMGGVTGLFALIGTFSSDRDIRTVDEAIGLFDDCWDSNIYRKGNFGSVDSFFSYYLLDDLNSKRVILGKDNWLFYRSATDESIGTVGDYTGSNLFTESEAETICERMLTIQRQTENKGIGFCIMACPNKSAVYDEFMPDRYIKAESSRTERLVAKMQDMGINALYPIDDFREGKSCQRLYYKYDTHWNQLGAYLASKAVMRRFELNADIEDIDKMIVEESLTYRYCALDDLAEMVHMRDLVFNDEMDYVFPDNSLIDWDGFEKEQEAGNLTHMHNDSALNDATLLIVGDSFRTAMIPSFITYFKDVFVVAYGGYNSHMIEVADPDYLLLEIVERNSANLSTINIWVE